VSERERAAEAAVASVDSPILKRARALAELDGFAWEPVLHEAPTRPQRFLSDEQRKEYFQRARSELTPPRLPYGIKLLGILIGFLLSTFVIGFLYARHQAQSEDRFGSIILRGLSVSTSANDKTEL
jgi:hypothetical protein